MYLAVRTKTYTQRSNVPVPRKPFSIIEALQIGEALSVYYEHFDIDQFITGLNSPRKIVRIQSVIGRRSVNLKKTR